jgi:hypothetical protein
MITIHFKQQPPCWDVLAAAVGVNWVPGMYVTYGSEIYCFDNEITDEFLVHEAVHVAQQRGIDPDEYVGRYVRDLAFRLEVELPAYRVHNEYLKATIKDESELWTKIYRNQKALARITQKPLEEIQQLMPNVS